MDIKTPKGWRQGQTIFNFLEWLHTSKGYSTNQTPRTADPFHIGDKELSELFEEFITIYG